MAQVLKTAGSRAIMRGVFKLPDGSVIHHSAVDIIPWEPRRKTDPYIFRAEVIGEQPAQFGGLSVSDDGVGGPGNYRLESYRHGTTRFDVQKLYPGTSFTLETPYHHGGRAVIPMKITIESRHTMITLEEIREKLKAIDEACALAEDLGCQHRYAAAKAEELGEELKSVFPGEFSYTTKFGWGRQFGGWVRLFGVQLQKPNLPTLEELYDRQLQLEQEKD